MIDLAELGAVVRRFQVAGEFVTAAPTGSGHIHDSYLVITERSGVQHRYVLQRINTRIFTRPAELMSNFERVTAHISSAVQHLPDSERHALRLVFAQDGRSYVIDEQDAWWRMFLHVGGARTYDVVQSVEQAWQVAHAFGKFQMQLASLPAPPLHEAIPDFHHTPKRFAALERAIEADTANRAKDARPEIEFALARRSMISVLLDAGLPERVGHNDTKINNVMLDDATGEGLCVIDLDTVMPGLALYDFGDMVRTMCSPAAEDERDLSKVSIRFEYFEALVRGYLSAAGPMLTSAEKRLLAVSGKLITFEIAIRFLADHLAGDTYFKVHRPNHNLDRCRTQFQLVRSIEEQEQYMNRFIEPFL